MRYGSICSGIEAATVAWHPLGWKPAFFSEIEAFPRAVLQYRYPDVPLHGDFTTIMEHDYDPIDLLVGGTPCQSFSIAGLRKGFADERGNLTLEFVRLAQRLRSRWLVWENVPGVLSIDRGRAFGSFLGALAELGYGFAYRVLDAQHFGVPQRRRRVFVVGYLGDWRPPAAVLFEREGLLRDITPRREAWKEVAPTIRSGSANGSRGHGARSGDSKDELIIPVASTGNTAHCLNAGGMGRQDYETETLVTHTLTRRYDSGSNGTEGGTPIVPVAFAQNCRGEVRTMELISALSTGGGKPGEGYPAIASFKAGQGAKAGGIGFDLNLSPTLGAAESGSNRTPSLMQGMSVRRLTPRECERLQGFPDDYTHVPKKTVREELPLGAGPCSKLTVTATLVATNGTHYVATNYTRHPHQSCPRKEMPSGQGYELCAMVCLQPAHAEINAIRLAGSNAEGGTLFVEGHTYACESCLAAAQAAGVKDVIVDKPPGNSADGPRYKALGNSMAVPVMRWIGERIESINKMLAV